MKKLLVVFPGLGYSSDRPLLYYARKIAGIKNYDVINADYAGTIKFGKTKISEETAQNGYIACKPILDKIDFRSYDKILFVSKSIGTTIGKISEKEILSSGKNPGMKIRHCLLSPLEMTFKYANENDIYMCGTEDQFTSMAAIKRFTVSNKVKFYLYERANHSLEVPDDIDATLKIEKDIISIYKKIII
ncbi:MAG: hypothetical protein LKI53_08345 [Bacteroidales bacterium]|jgi:hypothetical protein|nr:hypothetical protein [Bacteroidales bacterium]